MELTRTDAVFSRIAMVLFLCRNESYRNILKIYRDFFWNKRKIPTQRSTGGGGLVGHKPTGRDHPPGRAVRACGARVAPPPPNSALFILSRPKKIKEKVSSRFTIRRRHHLLFFISRADLESVSGSGEGKSSPSSSSTFFHREFCDALHRS